MIARAWQAACKRSPHVNEELLAALKGILQEFEDHDLGGACWVAAKVAIQRAEKELSK